jgi:hypothetical protein
MKSILLSLILATSLVVLVGCSGGTEKKAEKGQALATNVTANKMVGTYRMEATPEEIAQTGGVDRLPKLLLKATGEFSLTVESDVSKGKFVVKDGKVTLQEKDAEPQVFRITEDGYKLTSESDEDVAFVRHGVEGALPAGDKKKGS